MTYNSCIQYINIYEFMFVAQLYTNVERFKNLKTRFEMYSRFKINDMVFCYKKKQYFKYPKRQKNSDFQKKNIVQY